MNWYDRAEAYDTLFSWDPAAERDFVVGASERYGVGRARSLLEPFCGSGRMLRAMPGVTVGFDINPHMLRLAAQTSRVFRADAGCFATGPARFDAAFCLIDSFRHLLTEQQAAAHLRAVARALAPGGVYVVGLDLAGDVSQEAWEVDGIKITVGMLGDADRRNRIETFRARLDIRGEALESFQPMRTYTAAQLRSLVADEASFAIADCFDRRYHLDAPRPPKQLDQIPGSAVLVLRKSS